MVIFSSVTRAEYQALVSIGVIDWECRGYGPANPLLISQTNSRMSVFMQLILVISMLRIAMTSLRWQIRHHHLALYQSMTGW